MGHHFDGHSCRSADTGLCESQILVGVFPSPKSDPLGSCFGLHDFLDLDCSGNTELDQRG
jgi:hypothetical protein